MSKIILLLLTLSFGDITPVRDSYVSGSAPWCRVDNYGNANCFYYTYSGCMAGVDGSFWIGCGRR